MMVEARYLDHLNVGAGNMSQFMEKYPIGSFFIPAWYFFENGKGDTEGLIAKAIKDYSAAAKYPILFSEDFERGLSPPLSKSMPNEPIEPNLHSLQHYHAPVCRDVSLD